MQWDVTGRKLAAVRTYAWRCMECKICEVCGEKGDDEQIMFCDRCDRGWHLYCLTPPRDKPPRGLWFCPLCEAADQRAARATKHTAPPAAPRASTKRSRGHEGTHVVRLRVPPERPARRPRRPTVSSSSASSGDEAPTPPAPTDEAPFAGLLEGDDADTSANVPTPEDEACFERSRRAAQRQLGDAPPPVGPHPSADALAVEAACANSGKALPVRMIRFGAYDIDTWFQTPLPQEYAVVPDGRLWLCEFCLKYMKSRFMALRHRTKCIMHGPPGQEIYRCGRVSVFEVDGSKNKIYCQNLCLLAKLFLDHKTLCYDVEPFLFYIFTETDAHGAHFVGYFSKEKLSPMNYNVSCIMTLPIHQRRGWGYFLIEMSYLLSQREGRRGSPEKPLSDLGYLTYHSYWRIAVFRALLATGPRATPDALCERTGMERDDVLATLREAHMLEGTDESPHVTADMDVVRDVVARHDAKDYVRVHPDRLVWTPFLLPPLAPAKPTDEAHESGAQDAALDVK